MSATFSNALKARIESLGLSLTAYRDRAPAGTARPYVTISEGISTVRERHGDEGSSTAHRAATELVQVDLWDNWRADASHATGVAESYTLPGALIRGIDGADLTTAPKRVYGCTVDSSVRLVEEDQNLVHHAITVRLRRDL